MGSGDSAVGYDGMKPSTPREVARGIQKARVLLSGNEAAFGSFNARLADAGSEVPVYVAASGPKIMKVAAESADGVILLPGNLESKLVSITAAADDVSRVTPQSLVYLSCAITDDVSRLIHPIKPICLRMIQLEGTVDLEAQGLRVDAGGHIAGAEGDVGHGSDPIEMGKKLDLYVSDEAALWFAENRMLAGSVQEIDTRLQQLADTGVSGVVLNNFVSSELPNRFLESFSKSQFFRGTRTA